MGKRLKKISVVLLALVFVLSQFITVFCSSGAELGLNSAGPDEQTVKLVEEKYGRDLKSVRTNLLTRSNTRTSEERISERQQVQGLEGDAANDGKTEKDGIVPGQIIVKYKEGISSTEKSALSSKVSAVSSKSIPKLGLTKLQLSKSMDVKSAINKLKDDPGVEYVEPVYVRKAFGLRSVESESVVDSVYSSDPFYTNGWQWGLEALNMEDMWGATSVEERSQVTIAVIDTGVDTEHPELAGSIIDGYDFVNNDSDADDDNGHGTHVAGIAAAAHDSVGIAGVAGGAAIMPVKVLDENGGGSTVGIINGILYAVNNGADVINLSLGSYYPSRAEEEAIAYALDRRVTVIAAAGNDDGDDVNYPAAYDGVIAVGAVDWDSTSNDYNVADFSNVGQPAERQVDIFAPGVDILSSIPQELDNPGNRMFTGMGDENEDGYFLANGTSMAAPFVAGMAAMLLAEDSGLSCAAVLHELQDAAVPFTDNFFSGAEGEYILINSKVLNSGSGDNPPFSLKRAKLKREYLGDSSYNFTLSFEDNKNTVTDAVYGSFDLIKREFAYTNGFEWTTGPEPVDQIVIEEGQDEGTVTLDITEFNTNSVYYVDGIDGYMGSKPAYVIRDDSNSFDEATELEFETVLNASLDFMDDWDYYQFTVEESGYYIIESTGELDTYGYLYDAARHMIARNDDGEFSYNFRIEEDLSENRLTLVPGTYYVAVRGYDYEVLGDYGVVVRKINAVSGTVSLPTGTATAPIDVELALVERIWNPVREEYDTEYAGFDLVTIPAGQSSAAYSIEAYAGREYAVEYYIPSNTTNYATIGYLGDGGMFASYSQAVQVAAGNGSYNLTLIPTSATGDDVTGDLDPEKAPIQLNSEVNAAIQYFGDEDCYKLSITEEDDYIIGSGMDYNDGYFIHSEYLYNSSGYEVEFTDSVEGFDADGFYDYGKVHLTPGDYYFIVTTADNFPFDAFEYKVIADKVSDITGRIKLPGSLTASRPMDMDIIAENSQGMSFYKTVQIRAGQNYIDYILPVQEWNEYVVSYYYFDTDYNDEGYYTSSNTITKTTADMASAEVLDITNNISGIDMELLPPVIETDNEGNSKGEAEQVSFDTLTQGRINSSTDVDYFKFTVPTGGGYYNIDTQSEDAVSIYLETDGEWLLYDEGYESLIDGFFSQGAHYLKILARTNRYGDYSFTVNTLHKPVATNVRISGTTRVNSTLTGNYTYSDAESDAQSGTTYRWLKSDTYSGTYSEIPGATSTSYTLVQADLGKYVKFEVTPRTSNEPSVGLSVTSSAVGPIQAVVTNDNNNDDDNDGGGSRGGGGGGGGGSSAGTTTNNNSTANEQTGAGSAEVRKEADGTTTVEVKVDSTKVVNALTTAGNTPVAIDVKTAANQDNLDVSIPSEVFAKAAGVQKPVVINSNNVGFTIEPGTFDAGSLSGEVNLGVSQLSANSIADIIKNKDASAEEVSLVFDFDLSIGGKKITEFNKPMTITIKFDASKVTDLNKVGVYYYNEKDGRWEYVGGKANPDGTVTFTVDHFSKYTVMEYKKTFDDIKGHWAKADIELLIAKHVARSESETSFAPNNNITRAAFASMLVKALNLQDANTSKVFSDVPADAWYKSDVYKAYVAGIIGGVSSKDIAPDRQISREEMATMLMRAYEKATGEKLDQIVTTANVRFTDESSISSWARRNVILSNATGLLTGNPGGKYNPKGMTTKAEAVVAVKRLMEKMNQR